MTDPDRSTGPEPYGSLFRDVAVLVLVGAALGVAHNWFMLQAGPGKGLAWIKTERKVVRFEDTVPSGPDVPGALAPPVANPPAATPAAPAGTRGPASDAKAANGKPATTVAPGGTAKPATTPAASNAGAVTTGTGTSPAAAADPPADAPVIPESRDPLESGLALVRRLHTANAAVFVDARDAGEYAEGHIAGAINVPFDDVFRDPGRLEKFDDRGLPVVTYCGGGDCDLSRNLAFSLIDAGKRRVLVFVGGLPEWQQAGLPVNKGGQP